MRMSRRLIAVLSAVCIAALSVSAVALASSGGGDKQVEKHAKRTAHAHRGGGVGHGPAGFLGGGFLGVALDSLAQRLGVAPADLKAAVKAVGQERMDKELAAAGLSPAEIAAVKACRETRGFKKPGGAAAGATCDEAAWKSAVTKLQAARKAKAKPDLAALKTELATALGTKLNKTPDEVLAAVRAELDARLTQAVTAGWVTQKGHDLALACFDAPATCDLKALRAEVRFFGLGHGRKHHGDRKDGRKHERKLHPGRAASAPLLRG
jgi:hypothetical protein